MIVLFWCYCGLALSFTCGIYLIMWSTQTYTISRMTPGTSDHVSSTSCALLTILDSVDLPGLSVAHHRSTRWQTVCTSG